LGNRILVTGGAGFIGSNFIRYLLNCEDVFILNLDALTYAGNLNNLNDLNSHKKYAFCKGNINNYALIKKLILDYQIDSIINFAAESHVDRSILDSSAFIETNISGTANLLNIARDLEINRFLQISTDEVYGSLDKEGFFSENTPISPNSPYSASKASADMLVKAYNHTYKLPTIITRCSNNYGPMQFPEKLIPLMILNALENKDLPVYGNGMNVRDWIYVTDHCEAIWTVFKNGNTGEVYNIGGNCEKTNIEIVKYILSSLRKDESLIKFVADRPGHDQRYAIDNSKISNELGWHPKVNFEQGMMLTIDWYLNNNEWISQVRNGEYMKFYEIMYKNR